MTRRLFRCAGARWSLRRREGRVRALELRLRQRESATASRWDCGRRALYGIADSPVGLAAYFLDHDARSYELITRVFNGQSEGLTRDDILDNVTITWLTNTGVSGGRLYWENWGYVVLRCQGCRRRVPVAVSVFPDELYPAPRSWAERAYPKLIHYNKLPKGGHFAAWEQPKFLVRRGSRGLPIAAVDSSQERRR